jgi:hypothetical protein
MMRFRLFDWFLKDYEMNKHDNEYCLADLCSSLAKHVVILEERITTLEQKYEGALIDIKRLEEENIETSNVLYEIINSTEAIDRRIDIIFEELTK